MKLETMGNMANRLEGTGGGTQAKAVISAISSIENARGILDQQNAMTAIIHLAIAIAGIDGASWLIKSADYMLNPDNK
jgi:hypothetical protein